MGSESPIVKNIYIHMYVCMYMYERFADVSKLLGNFTLRNQVGFHFCANI